VFTFVISLVVVGAAIAFAARVVMNGAPKPATAERQRDRETRVEARVDPYDEVGPTPWWVRVRALVLLSVLATLIGALVALLVLLGGALVLTGLKNAVQ
jgi:hypothetical protein